MLISVLILLYIMLYRADQCYYFDDIKYITMFASNYCHIPIEYACSYISKYIPVLVVEIIDNAEFLPLEDPTKK